MRQELAKLGWEESDLARRRNGDPGKLALAARLRRETTMPLKWIARRVGLGTSKSANSNLHRWMKATPQARRRSNGNPTNSECKMNYYGLTLAYRPYGLGP